MGEIADKNLISDVGKRLSRISIDNNQVIFSDSDECIECSISETLEKHLVLKEKITNKNKIYNKDTLDKHIKPSYKLLYQNRPEDFPLNLLNPFDHSRCYTYVRIIEILKIQPIDVTHSKKVQIIGFFQKQNNDFLLIDKEYDINVKLKFTSSSNLPDNSSYVIISGYLNFDDDLAVITVYIWKNCIKPLVKKFDELFYNQRLQTQENNRKLWHESKDSTLDLSLINSGKLDVTEADMEDSLIFQ